MFSHYAKTRVTSAYKARSEKHPNLPLNQAELSQKRKLSPGTVDKHVCVYEECVSAHLGVTATRLLRVRVRMSNPLTGCPPYANFARHRNTKRRVISELRWHLDCICLTRDRKKLPANVKLLEQVYEGSIL